MTDTTTRLLPCPFCTSKKQTIIDLGSGYFTIECEDCPATLRKTVGRLNAIYMWNSRAPIPEAIVNEEMAQVLQDVVTLCEQGEFEVDVFLDFISDGKTRHLMQYHRDYFHKLTSRQ